MNLNMIQHYLYVYFQLKDIYNYISNHAHHHKKRTFREEYLALLKKFEIVFNEKYLFEFFD